MFFVIKRQTVIMTIVALIGIISVGFWLYIGSDDVTAFNETDEEPIREYHIVTTEFKTTTSDGKELESYRWDPGTIFVEKGETVRLKLLGFNGKEHPFIIEGTDYKGTVSKGEETVIDVKFDKEGIYRLICLTHHDTKENGPMIGYIVVD